MIIHRLKLQRFKRFQDYEIHLQPGLNVIKGPNEAGKSTLLEALVSCFFYDSQARIEGYRRWNSSLRPGLELEFSVAGQRLLLKKDFEEAAVSLGYSNGAREETSGKKIKRLLAGYLGFDTDRAFLATSCIRQHELDTVTGDKIPFRLENILLGGADSVDVSAILGQLDKAVSELKPRPKARNPGPLITLPSEIKNLEEPLKKINVLSGEGARFRGELARLEEQYKPKDILWERAQCYRRWREDNHRLSGEFGEVQKRIDEVKSLKERYDRCEREIAQNSHFKDLGEADRLSEEISSYNPGWNWWLIFILTFGIAYIIYKIKLRRILNRAGCSTAGEFRRVYREYKELQKRRGELKIKLEGFSQDKLDGAKTDIARQLAVNEERLTPEVKAADLSGEAFIKLEGEVSELKAKIQYLERLCEKYDIRLETIVQDKGDRIDIEEGLYVLREDLARVRGRFEVLSLAREIMERARKDVLLSGIEDFNREIARYLALFTGQRYTGIKTEISERGMQFLIYSPEKNEWISPEELSSGTQDQLYLAARITLLKLVAGECRPPLIMDDPFTGFDRGRLDSAMQICREIAGEYQVILFTCTGQYDRYADNVIQLEYEPQEISSL